MFLNLGLISWNLQHNEGGGGLHVRGTKTRDIKPIRAATISYRESCPFKPLYSVCFLKACLTSISGLLCLKG